MSSFTRRMQIRGLKMAGFRRTKFRVAKDPDGKERKISVARGGLIVNAEGERVGYRWPRPLRAVG